MARIFIHYCKIMSVLFLTVVNLVLCNKFDSSLLVAKAVIHRTYIQLLSKLYFCYCKDLLLILNGMNDIFIHTIQNL